MAGGRGIRGTGERWASFLVAGCLGTTAVAGASCFIDNPGAAPPATGTTSTTAGTGGDESGDAGDAGMTALGACDAAPPSLCDMKGGYPVIQTVVDQLLARLDADCRIGAFFTALPPAHRQHFADCITKQLAVMTHCQCIRYDVDSQGADCRDMKTAHHGMGLRQADYEAFVEDVKLSFGSAGFGTDDIKTFAPALGFFSVDIVTNSAPGLSKGACAGGDGG